MIISEILEGVLGGGGRDGGGILSESKEAIFGGCYGLMMSGVFFFLFYLTSLAFITGVSYLEYRLNLTTAPLIFALCASGLASPFLGVMWGLRGGQYSMVQHFGCFFIYVSAILGGMVALVVLF